MNVMKNILGLKHLKLAHKYFILKVIRQLNLDFTVSEHFPDIEKLSLDYYYLQMSVDSFKDFVCNELIEECNIDKSSFYLQGFEKKYIITMDIKKLEKHGLIRPDSNFMSHTKGLLNYLEPFPFDSELFSVDKTQSPHFLTIKFLRDSIEKQYLAWKFNCDLSRINNIIFRLQPCMFTGRSLRSLRRNCDVLDLIPGFRNECLLNKIYLINQQPFNVNLALKFKEYLPYLNWDLFSKPGSTALHFSFHHIYFFIKILEEKGFTITQIQEIAPFLQYGFKNIIYKLNIILSHPVLSGYQTHYEFLRLLLYPAVCLKNLENQNFQSLKELMDTMTMMYNKMKLNHGTRRINSKSIEYQTSNYFTIDEEHLNVLKRHPNYTLVTELQLDSTLMFLQKYGFSNEEILESIMIILYPREMISKGLTIIAKESEILNELGFVNGYLPEETNFFKAGTKLRRKTLQLCLYYIEKQFNFTWRGILYLPAKKTGNSDE